MCHECQCPPCLNCGKRADDADSVACRTQDNYYCEDCRKDHKLKQCRKCGESKSLTCYPEDVRRHVEKRGKIDHKNHWCTECIESKEEHKEDWLSACIAEKTKKQCRSCEKWKSIGSYPETVQAAIAKRKKICNMEHSCSKCKEKDA